MRRRAPLVLVILLAATPMLARTLSWNRMTVVAQLDAEGRLHSSETLTYLFDGDWNGGERTYDVRVGQSLGLIGVYRLDGGKTIPLVNGDLTAVDRYQMMPGGVLRWRSRLPDDPPFANQEITYRIDYTLTGVLRKSGSTYRLNHDFSFSKRDGAIRNFSLTLTIDPAWKGSERTVAISRPFVPPGQGVVVTRELTHQGAAQPGAVVAGISRPVSFAVAVLYLAALGVLVVRFQKRESEHRRFDTLLVPSQIDEPWLAAHVFSKPPEVVGAALTDKVGPEEVAAVLARMAQEKKISTSVEKHSLRKPVLHMKLLVNRETLTGYELSLVKKLFFNNRVETDTHAVRDHYSGVGLDLAATIKGGVEAQMQSLPKWNSKKERANWKADSLAIVAALVFLILAAFQGGNDTAFATMLILVGCICLAAAAIAANFNCHAVDGLVRRFAIVGVFLLPLLWITFHYIIAAGNYLVHIPTLFAIALWDLAIVNLVLDALRIPDAPEKVAFRRQLAAAKRYFVRQLREREPRLHDEWLPYLLAFGLGSNVDSWFRSSGGAAAASAMPDSRRSESFGSSSSSSGGLSGWTGGGGGFGGAGATGSWAAAAGVIASGVAAPSSSSSSGGGGGGSSSGGGGGGGW